MRIINATVGQTIPLGRMGENERTTIVFDVSDILEEYPDATISLYNRRPHETGAYPIELDDPEEGNVAWKITSTELGLEGVGQCELIAIDDETIVKGIVWNTIVYKALDDTEEPPEPWESYLDEFRGLKSDAEEAAEDAEDSAEDAEAYAKGTRGGEDVESSDPAYHNNSKYYANVSETAAASAAAAYGTALLAPNYSSSSTYKVGDHVIYSGNYYVCKTAITTAEAWTAAHWTQVTVGGEAADLKSALNERPLLGGLGMIPVENGTVPAPFNNLNTYPANTIYTAPDAATSSLIANCPIEAPVGRFVVVTLEGNPTAPYTRLQFFASQTNEAGQSGDDYKNVYFRKEWGNWSGWQRLAKGSEITGIFQTLNPIRDAFANKEVLQSMGEIPVSDGAVAEPLNDLNTYPSNTIYLAMDQATSSLVNNCPVEQSVGRFVVITLDGNVSNGYVKMQFFISREQEIYYRKQWGSWSAWHKIITDSDYNNLVRNMGTIPVVDGAVAAPLNNLNTFPANTVYVAFDQATSELVTNCPVDQPVGRYKVITLEANPSAPYTRVQFFISREGDIFYRTEWGNWSAWQHLTKDDNYWNQKSVVWLGTSIPAGGRGPAGRNDNGSYPFKTKKILGNYVDIINNAVGSSCLWVLKKDLINASTNPYGFDFNYAWERVERCIGLTKAEKQWMIDHKSNWQDAPASLTDEEKERIINYSYENLVLPYIGEDRLWIFDYTNNEDSADEFGTYDPEHPFDRYSTKGTLQLFWNMILSANPKSSILVLGNYYTDSGIHGRQNTFFENLAKEWSFPFFRVYEHVSASPEVTITTKGGWDSNGYWNNELYPNGHTMTLKQVFARDGLHPHTDASGKTNDQLARIIGSWINQQAVWFEGE